MGVYEKATRRAWWLQGPVALRELLRFVYLRRSVSPATITGIHGRHFLAEPVPLVSSGYGGAWWKPV
jgi:hypothetical protein